MIERFDKDRANPQTLQGVPQTILSHYLSSAPHDSLSMGLLRGQYRIVWKMYCFNFEKQYICVLELFKELKQLCTENSAGFVKSCTNFSANC